MDTPERSVSPDAEKACSVNLEQTLSADLPMISATRIEILDVD